MQPKTSSITTFVFDMGGVLFADGSQTSATLKTEKNYDPDLIKKIIRSDVRHNAMRGKITDNEFWQWAKAELPPDYDIDYIRHTFYESYSMDEDAMALALKLKKLDYRIIIFSGNMKTRVEYLDKKYNFLKNFETAVFSFNEGYTKPDLEFFDALVRSLGCDPGQAFLIDDREFNIAYMKEKYGMDGAIYSQGQIENLINKLKEIGIKI